MLYEVKPMMMTYPQFLSEEELTDYKKDTCLFCNEQFRTRSKSETHEVYGSSCEYSYGYTVTTTTHYVVDLDLYHFSFQFQGKDEEKMRQQKQQLQKDITIQMESEAPLVEQELRERLNDLPERWKDKKEKVVDILVTEHLSELRPQSSWDKSSPLEKRLERLFHNLEFGDLQLVEEGYERFSRNSQTGYCPRGLKSHHRCWPYAPLSEPTEVMMPFGQFVGPILKNKQFADYEKLFMEIQEIWKEVQQMPITVKAQQYNPVDWMVR